MKKFDTLPTNIYIYIFIYIGYVSRIRRNLFIHIARFSAKRISSSIYQHFKIPPPFASNEGYTASGTRYRERRRVRQQPTASFFFSRNGVKTCSFQLTFSYISFCLLFLYFVIFIFNYYFYSDIITLIIVCLFYSRVCVDVDGFLRFFGFPRLSLSCINGRQINPGNPSRWFRSFALITQQVSVLCYTLSRILLVI